MAVDKIKPIGLLSQNTHLGHQLSPHPQGSVRTEGRSEYFRLCSPLQMFLIMLLPIGSEEKGVLGVGSIPIAILPSCQDMETVAL